MDLLNALKFIFALTAPYIKDLIESKVVPVLKRKAYEKLDEKADKLIEDLAQNANKIASTNDPIKKAAFVEGTKLGIETLRAMASKFNQAAGEIEKALNV